MTKSQWAVLIAVDVIFAMGLVWACNLIFGAVANGLTASGWQPGALDNAGKVTTPNDGGSITTDQPIDYNAPAYARTNL